MRICNGSAAGTAQVGESMVSGTFSESRFGVCGLSIVVREGTLRLNTGHPSRHTSASGRRRCGRVEVQWEMSGEHRLAIRLYETK